MNCAVYWRGAISETTAEFIKLNMGTSCFKGFYSMKEDEIKKHKVFMSDEFQKYIDEGLLDTLVLPSPGKKINSILEQHRKLKNVALYYTYTGSSGQNIKLKKFGDEKPWLSVMEFHVADHCNMNCKGCGHCANLFKKPSFASCESYERDLARLSELYEGIGLIRLLGGEPLLNFRLDSFICLSRKYFPMSELHIVTNGILLTEMSDKLIDCIRNNRVRIDISLYPPMKQYKEKLKTFLVSVGIDHMIFSSEQFYKRFVPQGGFDKEISFKKCFSAENHLMYDGKIASCAMPFSIDKLNNEYGLSINANGWIDLYENGISGREINRRLDSPTELCRYCRPEPEYYDWKKSSKESIADWICI